MNMRTKTTLVFVAKVAVSAILLVILFQRLDAGVVTGMIRSASVPILALGMAWTLGLTAISTFKWRLLLLEQGVHAPYLALARIYLVSQFINLFMPSVAGGDTYRTLKLRHYTAGIQRALPSIVVERGTGLAALLLIGMLGLARLFYREQFWVILAALALAALVAYALLVGPVLRMIERTNQSRAYGIMGVLTQILQALRPSRRFAGVVAISFLFHLGVVVMCAIYSLATGVEVKLSQLLVAIPVVYFVEMLPISISGIGVREGTLTVMFGMMGLVPEHGLLLGLTITMMRYVTYGLAGGPLFALELFGKSNRPKQTVQADDNLPQGAVRAEGHKPDVARKGPAPPR